MNDTTKSAIVLGLISLVAAFMLSFVNGITSDVIEQNAIDKQIGALRQIYTESNAEFSVVEIDEENPYNVSSAFSSQINNETVGYVFNVSVVGYAGEIVMAVGINTDGSIHGIKILSHIESKGLGTSQQDDLLVQYIDKTVDAFEVVTGAPSNDNQIEAMSGATVSSRAVTTAINNALTIYKEVGGLD